VPCLLQAPAAQSDGSPEGIAALADSFRKFS